MFKSTVMTCAARVFGYKSIEREKAGVPGRMNR